MHLSTRPVDHSAIFSVFLVGQPCYARAEVIRVTHIRIEDILQGCHLCPRPVVLDEHFFLLHMVGVKELGSRDLKILWFSIELLNGLRERSFESFLFHGLEGFDALLLLCQFEQLH